ncbi:MAG TPA: hypothetical protein VKH45_00990 [Candidatus Acidoferrum sp.]|nr:hypothetical protein [Candidatus Acidoferrum sp.]
MKLKRILPVLLLVLSAANASVIAAQQSKGTALGLVVKAESAQVDKATANEGTTIYSGDYLATENGGSLLVRVGGLSLNLEAASGAHIYRTPYGAIVELDEGSVVYTTPGNNENIVVVANDVRVTPALSVADLGRVSINDPCNVTVYSQRGQVNVQSGSESHFVQEGKAYKVRAENEVSYRQYVSPEDNDYHNYHGHKPCGPVEMIKGHAPIAAGQSHFLLVTGVLAGTATGIGIWKALESPNRP